MQTTSISTSESLIGGLFREIEYLKVRYKAITTLNKSSNDQLLKDRFNNEIIDLIRRRDEILSISKLLKQNYNIDRLSILLLNEVGTRAFK